MMEEQIIECFTRTKKAFSKHHDYPNSPGLYAFFMAANSKLKSFGEDGQVLYVGKAEKSLESRDFKTHFHDLRTGSSSLRRSIGAIMKRDLDLTAFSRNGTLDTRALDHYVYDFAGEERLTCWMRENLEFGYWEYDGSIAKGERLGPIEIRLSIILRPTLDLSRATKKYNIHAEDLDRLRHICRDESGENVINDVSRS